MRLNRAIFLLGGLMAVLCLGCIRNDIPYPVIPQNILSIAAEGESAPAIINDRELKAEIFLEETVDPSKVKFTRFEISEGAESSVDLLSGTFDLREPLKVVLTRYQEYEWTVSAIQEIQRYFTISGQVGATIIDPATRRIVIKVPESAKLSSLKVESIKLGPAGITEISPAVAAGDALNCTKPVEFTVTYFNESKVWTLYVEKTAAVVTTVAVDAWSEVIWAYGTAQAGKEAGFRYRKVTDAEWIDVPSEYITFDGGSLSAYIPHLTPLTTYEVMAVSGSDTGEVFTVTTQSTELLPDGDFDQWWLNGRIWCPWNENGTRFWDTGNTGAATLGQSNVQPSDHVPPGLSGQSAMLATRFVGIGAIGKLAAGSIYTGTFAKVDGTNGILDFGRPWKVRPTKLKGYYQYTTAPISDASAEYKYLLGRPDSCHIYVALTDWTAPYQVRTNPNNRQLFDKNSPEIIAYGELVRGSDTNGYQEFEIKLQYRSTSRVPSYIQITCAASKYGDFFTGGRGAVLYVDQLSLHYDY